MDTNSAVDIPINVSSVDAVLSKDSEKDHSTPITQKTELGGIVEQTAFALLCGLGEDQAGKPAMCQYAITRLPAILGRTHKGHDQNFVGLGASKALSRNHCIIYYRDVHGGRINQRDGAEDFIYSPKQKRLKASTQTTTTNSGTKEEDDEEEVEAKDIIMPTSFTKTAPSSVGDESNKHDSGLPPHGFFVVKCLGKNKIVVGGKTVSKGQVAILNDRITLQLASYKLYFLLPLHNDENDQIPSILEVPNPEYEAYISAMLKSKTVRKRSIEPYSGTSAAAHDEDELSVGELMQKMSDAIKANQWDRRQQMLGTTIAHHAVLDAAKSTECQKIAKKMNGTVSRSEIMKWIKNSPKYSNWVSEMQSRMEFKSYQSSIGKALNRAGFERTGTTGRHVRWILPSDIYLDASEPDIDANDGSEEREEDEDPESESGSIHVDANHQGEASHDVEQDFESQNNSFDIDHGEEDEEMLSQEIDND